MNRTILRLRKAALALPAVEEGVACEGTAIEKRTIKVGGKAFVFLGVRDVMLKLGPSLDAAKKRATAQPDALKVGATGWATVQLEADDAPGPELLELWIEESYTLVAKPKSASQKKKR